MPHPENPEEMRHLIAENLAEFAEDAGVSQSDLAREMGYTRHWAQRRLNGVASIRLEELPRILSILGITDPSVLWQPKQVQTKFRAFDDF